jgi:hypothetical protein
MGRRRFRLRLHPAMAQPSASTALRFCAAARLRAMRGWRNGVQTCTKIPLGGNVAMCSDVYYVLGASVRPFGTQLQQRINSMRHLLTGVAVVAALAFSAPGWAQNPGQGGFGPKASGGVNIPPSTPPAAMTPSTEAPPAAESTSAMPPSHHRHAHHRMAAHHYHGRGPAPTGSTAEQLNQEELARLQAGNMPPPSQGMAPPPPGPAPYPPPRPPIGSSRGSNLPGPKQSGGY